MQKRFCSCGFALLVDYVKHSGNWTYTLLDTTKHCPYIVCPHCHRPLHIDALR
jgi:hypothetical protein